jgi:hypothetical protein
MGFGTEQLTVKALAVVEEAAKESDRRPVQRGPGLAFALAYLWSISGAQRWPFDSFWQAVAGRDYIGRSQSVNAARNAVYAALRMNPPD